MMSKDGFFLITVKQEISFEKNNEKTTVDRKAMKQSPTL